MPPGRAADFETGIQCWQSLTEDYTQCLLTYDSDKLAAIAGLAERLGKKNDEEHSTGIFHDDEGNGLLWRSYSEHPMTRSESFHASSWTWAAYKGPITYGLGRNREMTSTCDISKPVFNISSRCPHKCSKKPITCVTGSVKWIGTIGIAFKSCNLGSLKLSDDEDLIRILGSDVHWEPRPTLRFVQGVSEEIPRKLSIPDRTEVIKDEKDSTLGWILLDTDEFITAEAPLFCAVIRRWQRTARLAPSVGLIPGFDYMGEEYMDVLVLKDCDEKPWMYQRIGVGRIVDKNWLRCCTRQAIEVW